MDRSQISAQLMMLAASLIWGGAFVAQKAAMEHMGPLEFNGIRFLLGAVSLMGVEKFALLRRNSLQSAGQHSVALKRGLLAGLALFGAATLQQVGLVHTTAGKAGLITGLYVVMVPLSCFFVGRKPSGGALLGGVSAWIGLYLLSGEKLLQPETGDLWVLLSAVMWSLHVLLLAYFSPGTEPLALAKIQDMVCAVLSLTAAALWEDFEAMGLLLAWKELLYGGLISVGVAYTLQVAAQKRVHPAHAAVLLSLEGFFAALAGVIFLGEAMGLRELTGGSLMLWGVLLAQLWAGNTRPNGPETPALGN